MNRDELRALPSVDEVLRAVAGLADLDPVVARWLARREVDAARASILDGGSPSDVVGSVERALDRLQVRRIRRVINATGVVLHTNLGRAPLSAEARAAVVEAMDAASIEFDVASGERAARAPVTSTLAAALCDAEDALVVNNNAAALLLALAALAHGREVVVSRGELIEIGGSFRLPEVMAASGALMREVGTTNITRTSDYGRACGERTGLILKVHPSNYRIEGFTEAPPVHELTQVARAAGVPLLFDTGSGLLAPDDALPDEPDARSALAAGADLVCFSGDKLLGGPQAGIIAGRADLVARCRDHPIARAVRADKLSLAALEATLLTIARGGSTPVRAMLEAPLEDILRRARALAGPIGAQVVAGESTVGGGSAPGTGIPTMLVRIDSDHPGRDAAHLRTQDPPVIARIAGGALVLDLRTVRPEDDAIVARALASLHR